MKNMGNSRENAPFTLSRTPIPPPVEAENTASEKDEKREDEKDEEENEVMGAL